MRKILFTCFLFFNAAAFAQQNDTVYLISPHHQYRQQQSEHGPKWFDRFCSLGISKGYSSFGGDNFIAKTYKPYSPFVIDIQSNIAENIGFGFYLKQGNSLLKTTQYVGNSTGGRFTNWGLYLCYYWMLGKKWVVVPKIGIASFDLKNQIWSSFDQQNYDYYTGGSSYFVSADINYFLTKQVSAFCNAEFNYTDLSNINANSITGTSYHHATQVDVQFGIKLWLLK